MKIGVDQYGQVYGGLVHPRKDLKEGHRLPGAVSRMYRDKRDGSTVKVGYVIGQLWIALYESLEVKV